MKTVCNIATQKSRFKTLPIMLDSIYHQVDEINIWANGFTYWSLLKKYILDNGLDRFKEKVKFYYDKDYEIVEGHDLTDNGKFWPLQLNQDATLTLLCDDDIIYPPDYVTNIKADMLRHPAHIITYHGRILQAKGLPYYHAHRQFRFDRNQELDCQVHVGGTGVMAFDTSLFNPTELYRSAYLRMSDLVLAQYAASEGIPIMCCRHPANWIRPIPGIEDTILNGFKDLETPVQNEIADRLIDECRFSNS